MLVFDKNLILALKKTIRHLFVFLCLLIVIDAISFTEIGDVILGKIFFATGYRRIGSTEICPAIEKAEESKGYTKVILGDSVCHQVFEGFQGLNDDYLFLGTNQAITMDGQYILARLFLEAHPDATDVYLVMLPGAFASGFDSEMSYCYLIEPFGRLGKLGYLSDYSVDGIKSLYGKMALSKSMIRFRDDSCINNKLYLFYNQERLIDFRNEQDSLMSSEAEYYMNDLLDICKESNVELHILPGPIRDTYDNHESVNRLKSSIQNTEVESLFDEYFKCITYYPEEMFPDGVHFGGEYANEITYRGCIITLKEKSEKFEGLLY